MSPLLVCDRGQKTKPSVRAIFCGSSNCGKTNASLALLIHPNVLRFENVYIYSKSLNQPKYEFLEKILYSVNGVEYYPFNEHDDVKKKSEVKENIDDYDDDDGDDDDCDLIFKSFDNEQGDEKEDSSNLEQPTLNETETNLEPCSSSSF